MEKNAIVRLDIEDMTEDGEGIGKADGYPVFVRDAVIGDTVQARVVKAGKTYGYGRLMEVLTPSPDRAVPRCPVSGPCGGCQLQQISYEAQLSFKKRKVESSLRRIGGLTDIQVLPVIGMENPWEYRNKCQVPVREDASGRIQMGFYAGRSHRIVETPHCFLADPVNERILALVRSHMEGLRIRPYNEQTGKGLVRHVLIRRAMSSGEILVCLILNGKKLPGADLLISSLREIPGMTSVSVNINTRRDNVILGPETVNLFGPGYIRDRIGDITFRISPESFYQVNPVQTEKLYQTALSAAGLTGNETVWDLYCGIGTISLFLARHAAKVYGVEIVPAAVENARANAADNGITNAEFHQGRAEQVFPAYCKQELARSGRMPEADVIVVDPPRKGCDAILLQTILQMAPRRIVYVSCNAATLARDLKILTAGGYAVRMVQPVDMFPQTVGIETVALLTR